MKKLKRNILTALVTTSTLFLSALPPFASAATVVTITLGDVNNDGRVNMIDVANIEQYLGGAYAADAKPFTAMDVNEDGIIDKTDESMISHYLAGDNSSKIGKKVTKTCYTLPQNTDVSYRRHDCSDSNLRSYKSYTIPLANSISSVSEEPSLCSSDVNTKDTENVACVEIFSNGAFVGSGFIISNDTIATAAHCIYDDATSSFLRNVTVKMHNPEIVNGQTKDVIYTANAEFLHIPSGYTASAGGNDYNVNYDYGLIRIGSFKNENNKTINIRNYCVNLGIMTDEFINEEQGSLTSVGYINNNNQSTRYQSTGRINTNIPQEEYSYRYHILAQGSYDKSGGMTYFDSTYTNAEGYTIDTRSTVGIHTSNTGGKDSYGVRITPNLLRFYYSSKSFEEE